jgi:hypothetical protein
MRVASVGLVKEALLEALSLPPRTENIFLTSLFLRSFGPILFRPNPSDLFTSANLTLSEFQESHEPQRLVECLSLYYVLLLRDKSNLVCSLYVILLACNLADSNQQTGIRDTSLLKAVDTNLLTPLKSHLKRWTENAAVSTGKKSFYVCILVTCILDLTLAHHHDITPVVSLEISLERVDVARASLLVQDSNVSS